MTLLERKNNLIRYGTIRTIDDWGDELGEHRIYTVVQRETGKVYSIKMTNGEVLSIDHEDDGHE